VSALVAAPAELEPPARVEARARLRRPRELPALLSERERVVLARVLAGASLADAGAGLGANPTKLADNALTRARRKARDLLALEDAAYGGRPAFAAGPTARSVRPAGYGELQFLAEEL